MTRKVVTTTHVGRTLDEQVTHGAAPAALPLALWLIMLGAVVAPRRLNRGAA